MQKTDALNFLDALETGVERVFNENFSLNVENKQKILEVFKVLSIETIDSAPF